MRHLSEIVRPIWRRICDARAERRQNKIKQHWQAGAIGGGATIQLGLLTRRQAIGFVEALKDGPIVYVDDSRGFIAFGRMPEL